MTYAAGNRDFLKTLTLLYVEDDSATREQFTIFLERLVGRLIIAKDGQEGLDAFHCHRLDIVLTDIQMPVLDGLSMARQIHEKAPELPVIVITAHEMTDYPINADCLGINRHVTKPVECDRLIKCLIECAEIVRVNKTRQHLSE